MKFKVIKLLVIALLLELSEGKGTFTLIAPKTIRTSKDYRVSVTSQGYDQGYDNPEILEVSIVNTELDPFSSGGDHDDFPYKEFRMAKNVTLGNGGTEFVTFDLKDLPQGYYSLETRTFSEIGFYGFRALHMNTKNQTVFVQTDKSIYKPADKVQFRVLVLDGDMKPLMGVGKVQVQINDGAKNRVKQFDDITLIKGVTFTLIAPKTIRTNKDYRVSVTSQGYDNPEILEVGIKSTEKRNDSYSGGSDDYSYSGGDEEFKMLKDLPQGYYSLKARTFAETYFFFFRALHMNTKNQTVFVQTDKSIYKPADKVQFRVLVLDGDMKPLMGVGKVQVQINDGAKNRVKQFDDITLIKGVYQNELQLSDMPVMGKWNIQVNINGKSEKVKTFEVAEYTLPKFEVTIDSNPDVSFKDGKIRATVKAKYTFGKIAKGNATVTAEVTYTRRRRSGDHRRTPVTEASRPIMKTVEVDGKKSVEFDIEKELNIADHSYERSVKLFATFKEELSDREANATTTVKIHPTPHYIELKKSDDEFKPGLPFTATAIVKYHDKGAPVDDKYNPVVFTIKYSYDVIKTCERPHR
ncbi:CLUMA_CG013141, isoform B, partial [Clunio marinus]